MGNGKIRALELSMDNLLKEYENSDISIKELKDFSDYCRIYCAYSKIVPSSGKSVKFISQVLFCFNILGLVLTTQP